METYRYIFLLIYSIIILMIFYRLKNIYGLHKSNEFHTYIKNVLRSMAVNFITSDDISKFYVMPLLVTEG
jgi:uncharacterized membrane protein